MTTTNKGGWSIPGSKNSLHGKLERIVLQVDRGADATQDSTHAQGYIECNKAEKSCWKIVQHGLSTATGWSSATKRLANLSDMFNCRVVVPNHRTTYGLWDKVHKERINGEGFLLICQRSKATHIHVESRVCLHSLYKTLNEDMHSHRAVKIESLVM